MTFPHHKTLDDGSIDYGYYKQRGRRMRINAAGALFTALRKLVAALAGQLTDRAMPKPRVKLHR